MLLPRVNKNHASATLRITHTARATQTQAIAIVECQGVHIGEVLWGGQYGAILGA